MDESWKEKYHENGRFIKGFTGVSMCGKSLSLSLPWLTALYRYIILILRAVGLLVCIDGWICWIIKGTAPVFLSMGVMWRLILARQFSWARDVENGKDRLKVGGKVYMSVFMAHPMTMKQNRKMYYQFIDLCMYVTPEWLIRFTAHVLLIYFDIKMYCKFSLMSFIVCKLVIKW